MTRTLWLLAALAAGPAWADDASNLAPALSVLPGTTLFVDVLDPLSDRIAYTGTSPIEVFRPDGSFLGNFNTGDTIVPDQRGAYRVELARRLSNWSIEIAGRTGGRVWSTDWRIESKSFTEANAIDTSFYALVPGGGANRDGIVEARMAGLGGYVFRVVAAQAGQPGARVRSVPDVGQVFGGGVPLYLEPPEASLGGVITPALTEQSVVYEQADCATVLPGRWGVSVPFTSNVEGRWHLICDGDADGIPDASSDADVHLVGRADAGPNTITWDGRTRDGAPVGAGTLSCELWLTSGELHLVTKDVETLHPGMRFIDHDASTGLPMFWNDTAVQGNAVNMPAGGSPLEASGPDGVFASAGATAIVPNANARAWGNFSAQSKGAGAWLDTWTALETAVATFALEVADPKADGDGDTLVDIEERCVFGTDPTKPDTDDDGASDAIEVGVSPSDPLVADSDGDCLLDGLELNDDGTSPDTDQDGVPDVLDDDDDGDSVPTCDELVDGVANDLDGDGLPNHRDQDSDGDQYSDGLERGGDVDADGQADFLDADTVGVGQTYGEGWFGGGCGCNGSGAPIGWLAVLTGLFAVSRRRS